jgi:hypothetical protein
MKGSALLIALMIICGFTVTAHAGASAQSPAECPAGDPVCEYLNKETEAPPLSESTGTLPGAIEPLPVNPVIEAEFWADVAERQARGKAAGPYRGPSLIELVPGLQAGWTGWCLTVQIASHTTRRCPVDPPGSGVSIAFEGWEAGASGTEGYALTDSSVTEVAVDDGAVAEATLPVIGFAGQLAATLIEVPDPFPAHWSDEFEVVEDGLRESGERGFSAPPRAPSRTLPASTWLAPESPPVGACKIVAGHLHGLRAISGGVLASLAPTPGVADRGLLSCANTVYSLRGSSLDAAVMLDAAQPGGQAPVMLPGARAVAGHRHLYRAPGAFGAILGRRVRAAWLLVEGGSSQGQRERVLAQLHAVITD